MTDAIRPLIAGNWKMNGLKASMAEFEAMIAGAGRSSAKADLLVCPPATLLAAFADRGICRRIKRRSRSARRIATPKPPAPIPAISPRKCWRMPAPAAVIVGHSERRADHGETDALVRQKAEAAWRAGLIAIVCIGETQAQRDAGQTLDVCGGQLSGSLPDGATAANLVVAYEPVWAIGTGLTPTAEDVEQVHQFIRDQPHRSV